MFVATRRLGRIAANGRLNASPLVGRERVYSRSVMDAKEKELYTERQAKLNRPVSPHVTIYAFPVVAISSIMNRVTGVALSAGVSGIGCAHLAGVDVGALAAYLGSTPVGPVLKFGVAFPLVYHYLGGIRHMVWDKTPDSLTNEEVQKSSIALIAGASVVSAGLALL